MKKFSLFLSVMILLSCCACEEKLPQPQQYEEKEFVLSGFWAPYELTEEAFLLYKNAGLNTFLMGNHSGEWSSEGLTYLGSERTMKSLELCRKTGLNATLQYGEWLYERIEGKPMVEKPFSTFDLYGEYKDIITGVHIYDEPNAATIKKAGNDAFTNDFKSVYSVPYIINLFPDYASAASLGTDNYSEYLELFEKEVLKDFPNNAYVSVDYYPFRADGFQNGWLRCYERIANLAKENNATTHFYMQTAVKNEFAHTLTEADMRLQVYVALCFGGEQISYYCYAMPRDGGEPMYEKCMLDKDSNPTDLYYIVQEINKEIQTFSSCFLAYDWVKTMGLTDFESLSANQGILKMKEELDFSDRKYVSSMATKGDCIVGCFERNEEEAYMLVNYGDPDETEEISVSLTLSGGANYVAIYGGENAGEPTVVKAKKGKVDISLQSGEGKFIVPLV